MLQIYGQRLLRFGLGLYSFCLVLLVVIVWSVGEGLWPVTLFLFGPRWVIALPLVVFFPLALFWERRLLSVIGINGLVVLFCLLDYQLPLQFITKTTKTAPDLRLVTWNVGGERFNITQLKRLITDVGPDVIVFQECQAALVSHLGRWNTHSEGKLCLLSRFPIQSVHRLDPNELWALSANAEMVRYTLATPRGPIFLTNVNLQSTPREGLELLLKLHLREGAWTLAARYNQRMSEARLVRRLVDQSPDLARLVAGDFNATIESDLLRTNWSGFQDCFSEAGQGFGFTKYVHHIGVRIDHIFAGADWVCLDARLWGPKNIGTDHRPLIVDMNWLGTVHE